MPAHAATPSALVDAAVRLRDAVDGLHFSLPVTHVYNPLRYAWDPHATYLRRFGASPKRVVFLGMNPGPWGMAQTGVPFGEVAAVTRWMQITGRVEKPVPEHPKRPVTGFQCTRSEVSGRRLWGLFSSRFPDPDAFFADHFVLNYCPLVWMEESGRNRTPDKLPAAEQQAVEIPCLDHLRSALAFLRPAFAVGIGAYARQKLEAVSPPGAPWAIFQIPHPSPANPAANRDWPGAATAALTMAGIWDAS